MRELDSINRAAKLLVGPSCEDFLGGTISQLLGVRLMGWKELGVFLACERD